MQTTTQGFKYVEPADAIADFPTPDQSNWKLVEARTPRRVTSAQMTALTGLVDGQEIELEVDATLGVYWRLRYRSASANASKWEFVGGPPLLKEVTVSDVISATGAYADAPNPGPAITLLRAGDYIAAFGFKCFNAGTGPWSATAALKLGAAAAADAQSLYAAGPSAGGSGFGSNVARTMLLPGRAAGDVLNLQYRTAGATCSYENRWLSIIPVRVS